MKNKKSRILIPPGNTEHILLHSCCAPCSCSIMETLKKNNIGCTVYFYNPNIDTEKEYELRKEENIKFAKKLGFDFYEGDYQQGSTVWAEYVAGFENEKERGKRCSLCFEMRLYAAAEFAFYNGVKVFTSSLGISRWKNFDEVCRCGIKVASKFSGVEYWINNWRKEGGSNRMVEISKEENFYRQQYCGCIYSKLTHYD
ncbi:MAG: epoxyqueuosine reductase QueH [Victivallales bacterium]|nr:epoxyqueuosine reductase QueH [Victivallales bacterium]